MGTESESYFVTPPRLVLNSPSSSLSLPSTGITGLHHHPWLRSVTLYFENMAVSHSLAHGLWLVCLLRCKMKRHTCLGARSSSHSSCCQGQAREARNASVMRGRKPPLGTSSPPSVYLSVVSVWRGDCVPQTLHNVLEYETSIPIHT